MIFNLSGGGNPANVLVVYVGESGATITVTKSGTSYTNTSDTAGYAYFKNLATGTWTVSAVNSSNHSAPSSPTVTITSTQTAYYVRIGFEFYLYDNSYANATTNQCSANSGGWSYVGTAEVDGIATRATGGGSAKAINSFDLSQYDTLALYYICSNGYSNSIKVKLSDNTVVATAECSSTSPDWVTIDISGLSYQIAYISVEANTYDVIKMYQCYLA